MIENPEISLQVKEVTCAEAAEALSQSAGIPLELVPGQPPGAPLPPVPALDEKASFDWRDTTFARALRQLCARYRLQPSWNRAAGYSLRMVQPAAVPGASEVGRIERAGIRLEVRSIGVGWSRSINFAGGRRSSGQGSLTVGFACRVEEGTAYRIAGLENVTAKDNWGQLLVWEPLPFADHSQAGWQFPDEWIGSARLTAPHPRAGRLEWLEGDLVVHPNVVARQIEFPLPLPEGGAREPVGDSFIELLYFQRGPMDGESASLQSGWPARFGPILYGRLHAPAGGQIVDPGLHGMPTAVLIGASGRTYVANGTSRAISGVDRPHEIDYRFPVIPEPPVKVRMQLIEKSRPERLFSFRMTDIPLPPELAFDHRPFPGRPERRAAASTVSEWRYFEKGGGVLVNQVEIEDRPAGPGTLSIGLSAGAGEGTDGTAWLDVEVDANGRARLEDVRPGRYRLLRFYRPKEVPDVVGSGRWIGGEVRIEVAAGQETAPPSLRWEGDVEA